MIGFALSLGRVEPLSPEDILQDGFSVRGEALQSLSVSPGTILRYQAREGGYIRLSAHTPFDVGPASIGIFTTIQSDYEQVFAGRPLRISYRARAASDDPLDVFHGMYVTLERNRSGWKAFTLGPEWQTYSFDFTPPNNGSSPDVDYVAIFPGKDGDSRAMELAEIRVDVITSDSSG